MALGIGARATIVTSAVIVSNWKLHVEACMCAVARTVANVELSEVTCIKAVARTAADGAILAYWWHNELQHYHGPA